MRVASVQPQVGVSVGVLMCVWVGGGAAVVERPDRVHRVNL